MDQGPYPYIPTEEEFQKYHLKRARITMSWLKQFQITPPILEYSEPTPFTKMLEAEYGTIEHIGIPEPDHGYPPFKGHVFKTIFCFEVLEHMMNPLFMLDRIHEYIATDGQLFITLPGALPVSCAREKINFYEMHEAEVRNLLLRTRFKFDIEAKRGTEMPVYSAAGLVRYFCRKRFFIHASPDWRKKENWWD